MKKQKLNYRFYRYEGKMLLAKNETPFEIKLASRMILDQLCYEWNKKYLQQKINDAIDSGDEHAFNKYGKLYRNYAWD